MPKLVEVPDFGEIEFPDEMPDEQIGTVIRETVFNLPSIPPMAEYDEKTYKDRRFISKSNLDLAAEDVNKRAGAVEDMAAAAKAGKADFGEEDVLRAAQEVRFARSRLDMAKADAEAVGKDPAPLGRSAQSTFASGILNTAAAAADLGAPKGIALSGKTWSAEDQKQYDNISAEIADIQDVEARQMEGSPTVANPRIEQLYAQLRVLENKPRSETLAGKLAGAAAEAPENLNINPRATNPAAQIGRGMGTVAAFLPTLALGGAALPAAVLQMGGQTYEAAYTQKEQELRASTNLSEAAIAVEAQNFASMKTAVAAPEFGAYMLGGKLASTLVSRMLPNASPVKQFLGGTAGATLANVGIAGGFRKWVHGQDFLPTLEQLTQDALFGLYQGGVEARGVAAKRRAAEEVVSEGVPPGDPITGRETPEFTGEKSPIVEAEVTPPAKKAPIAGPAIADASGEVFNKGTIGIEHKDLLTNEAVDARVAKDPDSFDGSFEHVFHDANGNILNRADAWNAAKENGQIKQEWLDAEVAGSIKPELQSQYLQEAPAPEPAAPGQTAQYNEGVDRQRDERGKAPVMLEGRRGNEVTWDAAMKRIDQNPQLPEIITDQLLSGERKAVNSEDQAVLGWRMAQLRTERNKVAERMMDEKLSPEQRADDTAQFEFIQKQLENTEEANTKFGSEWGRTGQFRQRLINDDLTLGNMMGREMAAKKAPLTAAEKTRVQEETIAAQEAQKVLEQRTEAAENQPVDEAIRNIEVEAAKDPAFTPEVRSLADRIVTRLEEASKGSSERIRGLMSKLGSQLSVGADVVTGVKLVKELAVKAALDIGRLGIKSTLKFTRWASKMVQEFGKGVEPYLKDAWDQADKTIEDVAVGSRPKKLTEPKRTKEESALKRYKTMAARKTAEIEQRIAKGDFAPRPRKKLDLTKDPEAVKAQATLSRINQDFKQRRARWKAAEDWKNKNVAQKIGYGIRKAWEARRNLFLGLDLTSTIQTAFAMAAHPIKGAVATAKGIRTFAESLFKKINTYADRQQARIELNPNNQNGVYKRMDLDLRMGEARDENAKSVIEELAKLETNWGGVPDIVKGLLNMRGKQIAKGAGKLLLTPFEILGRGIRASNEGYQAIANEMRSTTADAVLKNNYKDRTPTTQELKLLGNFVNAATGSGGLKGPETVGRAILFAPNWYLSNIKLLTLQPLAKAAYQGQGRATKAIAKEYVRALGTLGILLGARQLFFGNDRKNRLRSDELLRPDAGSITLPSGVRIDLTQGRAQWLSLFTRMTKGGYKDDRGRFHKQAPEQALLGFIKNRLSQEIRTGLTALGMKDFKGESITPAQFALDMVAPLSWKDVDKIIKAEGMTKGSFLQLMNFIFGNVRPPKKK